MPPDRSLPDPTTSLSIYVWADVRVSEAEVELADLGSGVVAVRTRVWADETPQGHVELAIRGVTAASCDLLDTRTNEDGFGSSDCRASQPATKPLGDTGFWVKGEAAWESYHDEAYYAGATFVWPVTVSLEDAGVAEGPGSRKIMTPSLNISDPDIRPRQVPLTYTYIAGGGPEMEWSGLMPSSVGRSAVSWRYQGPGFRPVSPTASCAAHGS